MISTSSVAPATQSTSIDNRVSRSSPSSRSRGGPTGRGPTGGSASNGSAGYGEKKHMYANLVWKKGKMPAPKPLVNANPEAIKVAYGGGYSMSLGSDSQGPPLRQGHSAEVLPKLQRPPPPNPRTGFVVGVDGLIYHGASLDSAASRPPETPNNQEQDALPQQPAGAEA